MTDFISLITRAEGRINVNGYAVVDGLAWYEKKCREGNKTYYDACNLSLPHRALQYLAQVSHESGGFTYDKEIWGPTKAQEGYEGRTDLGNDRPGDGFLFRGRTAIQNTGRRNARHFTDWARSFDPDAPNFEATPDFMLTNPWEGLSPIWYWTAGNPTGKSLNYYADEGNLEAITRKINGGINGLADRWSRYVKYAVAYFEMPSVFELQRMLGFKAQDVDGIAGAKTRTAIHEKLKTCSPFEFEFDRVAAVGSPMTPSPFSGNIMSIPVADDKGFTGQHAVISRELFQTMLKTWGT